MKRSRSSRAPSRVRCALTGAMIAAGCLFAAAAGPAHAVAGGKVRVTPAKGLAPAAASGDESPTRWHGESLAGQTKRWWRWWMSIPLGVNPSHETSGVNCGINQSGPDWFLGGPGSGTYTMTCTIPAGKAILSPVSNFVNDYPCPDPSFEPAPGQRLQQFLRAGVMPLVDSFTLVQALLDGKELRVHRVTTNLFPFTAAASLAALDPCATGSPQVGVADGYWVLIEPLPPGDHVLLLRAASPYTGVTDGTVNLKIR